MHQSVQFWVPEGVPQELQVALSIPGHPPKTTQEARDKLEFHLGRLAKELDENVGQGSACQFAYQVVPDQLLFLESETASPELVIQILMESDFFSLPLLEHVRGTQDKTLQT